MGENSIIKQEWREQNDTVAKQEEEQIRQKLQEDIAKLHYINIPKGKSWSPIVGIVSGFIIGGLTSSDIAAMVGVLIGIIACLVVEKKYIKQWNQSLDRKKQCLQDRAEQEICDAYAQADRATQEAIDKYDQTVKNYCQEILKNPDNIEPMVEHSVMMFRRMISHSDKGSHMKFVEADFIFQVQPTGIVYPYTSGYINPQDDFNFKRNRFHDLQDDCAECEGLAQALTKLTIRKMKILYPPDSISISVKHYDSAVVLHFRAANKNFVKAKDII